MRSHAIAITFFFASSPHTSTFVKNMMMRTRLHTQSTTSFEIYDERKKQNACMYVFRLVIAQIEP
jgi:hypothetical protein